MPTQIEPAPLKNGLSSRVYIFDKKGRAVEDYTIQAGGRTINCREVQEQPRIRKYWDSDWKKPGFKLFEIPSCEYTLVFAPSKPDDAYYRREILEAVEKRAGKEVTIVFVE